MVDYYYGRWNEGRTHEVLLHPRHSSRFGIYRTGTGPWAGQDPTNTAGAYVEGVEWLSGGAMPPFDFHKSSFQKTSPLRWSAVFRARGELHGAYGGETIFGPADPEFLTDAVSVKAQQAAVTSLPAGSTIDLASPGSTLGTPIAGYDGKLGWAHFGWYRPYVGELNEYNANHDEQWSFAGESQILFSIQNGSVWFRQGPDLSYGTFQQQWSTAGKYGVGPNRADWPEGVREIEVESTDRELLDVKINSNLAAGFKLLQKRPGIPDNPSARFPGALKPALETYGGLDISVADWERYWANIAANYEVGYDQRMELAVVPDIPGAAMMVTEAAVGPLNAYLQESLIHDTHDYSVYVKFRTAPWRYVYDLEPSIEGRADNIRRRFV